MPRGRLGTPGRISGRGPDPRRGGRFGDRTAVGTLNQLERGRESYRRRAWDDAYGSLRLADRMTPLGADDLELLATSAYLTGRDLEFYAYLDRAYRARLESGDRVRAAH